MSAHLLFQNNPNLKPITYSTHLFRHYFCSETIYYISYLREIFFFNNTTNGFFRYLVLNRVFLNR